LECLLAPFEEWRTKISTLPVLIVLILLLDLFITATRAAVLNTRYAKLTSMSEEEGLQVDRVLDLLKRRPTLRDSLRLILTLLRFLIAGLVFSYFFASQINQPGTVVAALLLSTALVIWIGEFFVERRILRNPEAWALRLTPFARLISVILGPFLVLPVRLANRGNGEAQQLVTITENELKSLVDASQREGVLEQDERKMIFSIFQFGDTLAREIMVPRIDMFALDVDTPVEEAADAVLESGYSRVPVYQDSVDNILGLLYTKDMLKAWRGQEKKNLRQLLRPANFIPESKKVDELLAEMQSQRIHIAIVADEYGGVAGLVTLEDIVEEIVGEIQDEYDQAEELPYQMISEDEAVFHGRIDLDDFNEIMDSHLATEEADTLGGYIYSRIGRVPKSGETILEDDLELIVEQITSRRIRKVRVRRTENERNSTEETTDAE
jgi:CBS domain containing-hemolysin-like protein